MDFDMNVELLYGLIWLYNSGELILMASLWV